MLCNQLETLCVCGFQIGVIINIFLLEMSPSLGILVINEISTLKSLSKLKYVSDIIPCWHDSSYVYVHWKSNSIITQIFVQFHYITIVRQSEIGQSTCDLELSHFTFHCPSKQPMSIWGWNFKVTLIACKTRVPVVATGILTCDIVIYGGHYFLYICSQINNSTKYVTFWTVIMTSCAVNEVAIYCSKLLLLLTLLFWGAESWSI